MDQKAKSRLAFGAVPFEVTAAAEKPAQWTAPGTSPLRRSPGVPLPYETGAVHQPH